MIKTVILSGSPQPLALSVSGLPAGVSAEFPQTIMSGDTVPLVLRANSAPAPGRHTITVVGRSPNSESSGRFVVVISPLCAGPEQMLSNPGFEDGMLGWVDVDRVIDMRREEALSGSWNAKLLGTKDDYADSLFLTVTLPFGCISYSLDLWLDIRSDEQPDQVHDELIVQAWLFDEPRLVTLRRWSNQDRMPGYRPYSADLSSLAGRTFQLEFQARDDRGGEPRSAWTM